VDAGEIKGMSNSRHPLERMKL